MQRQFVRQLQCQLADCQQCYTVCSADTESACMAPGPIWAGALSSLGVAAAFPGVSEHKTMAQKTVWSAQIQSLYSTSCSNMLKYGQLECWSYKARTILCRQKQLRLADWLTMHHAAAPIKLASHQLQCLGAQAAMSNKKEADADYETPGEEQL